MSVVVQESTNTIEVECTEASKDPGASITDRKLKNAFSCSVNCKGLEGRWSGEYLDSKESQLLRVQCKFSMH